MKTVLITGSSGFIGQHIVHIFKKNHYKTIGIDRTKKKLVNESYNPDIFFEHTINKDFLLNQNLDVDIIIHCAGGSSVSYSIEYPYEDYYSSVNTTVEILEYIKKSTKTIKLIFISSAAVYGDSKDLPFKTNSQTNPISPYGIHKKIAELMCHSYHKNFNIKVGIIRLFSVYGMGLKKQLLWDACNKMKNNLNIEFFGTGLETRDWINIKDVSNIIFNLSKKDLNFEIINGASNKNITNNNILKLLAKYIDYQGNITYNSILREGDPKDMLGQVDNKNINVDLQTGIKEYIEWFKKSN